MGMRFSPGMDISGYVIVGKELSNGANATSYKAQDKDGGYVFLKNYKSPSCRVSWYNDYIAYQNELKRRIEQSEILTGQTCRFLKFFEYRNSEGVSSYCQTFEFLEGGENLKTLLENSELTWLQRFTFAKLLMTGIRCLHKAGIIHADLKPDNIYLIPNDDIETKYSFRIIDFDRSLLSDRTAPWDGMEGYAGTPRYFSPEHTGKRIPSEASDVFTAGIILCELLSRNGHPFKTKKHKKFGLNQEEVNLLLSELNRLPESFSNVRLKTIISLLVFQGLRQIEVTRLDVEDISLGQMTALIHGKGRDDKEPIDLHPRSVEALKHYMTYCKSSFRPAFIILVLVIYNFI